VDLDGELGSKLDKVTCDVDHTRLTLSFRHRTEAILWLGKFHDFSQHFIVGGKQWNCTSVKKNPQFILRRVIGASESEHLGRDLTIVTSMARYDEVFETADISYGATRDEQCASEHALAHSVVGIDDDLCVGANADCKGHAKKALPLYDGASGRLKATCTDCYASMSADVFLSVKIHGFKLESMALGFRNMSIDASLQLDATAANSTTLAIDKAIDLVQTTYLLDFKVGAVPFMLYFDVPLTVQAELDFAANAALSFGAAAHLDFGELGLTWDRTNHWQHVTPKMVSTLTPSLSTAASLHVAGHVALTPKFSMHFDRMFSYSLTASPKLDATVAGSEATKQVCLASTYAMDLVSNAELDININLIDFHKDWTFGPTTVGSWSGVPLEKKCVHL